MSNYRGLALASIIEDAFSCSVDMLAIVAQEGSNAASIQVLRDSLANLLRHHNNGETLLALGDIWLECLYRTAKAIGMLTPEMITFGKVVLYEQPESKQEV